MKTCINLFISLLLIIPAHFTYAQAKEAEVTKVRETVKVVKLKDQSTHAAKVSEKVNSSQAVRTGAESNTELLFPNKTITRIGENSYFTFESSKNMRIQKGTMFFQMKKGGLETEIKTAAVTAAITGTTGFAQTKARISKIILLEGSSTIFLNSDPSQKKKIVGGKMLILQNGAKKLPDPVDIDVKTLFETAGLIQKMKNPDGSFGIDLAKIKEVIAQQAKQKKKGVLSKKGSVYRNDMKMISMMDTIRNVTETRPQGSHSSGTSAPVVLPSDPQVGGDAIPTGGLQDGGGFVGDRISEGY